MLDVSRLSWRDAQLKVRLGGLKALNYPDVPNIDRFYRQDCGACIYLEQDLMHQPLPTQYNFKVFNGSNMFVTVNKRVDDLRTAWEVFMNVFCEEYATAGYALVECGEVMHLIDVRARVLVEEWEMYMTLLERCEYLDKLHNAGCKFVPSGQEFFNK